MGGKLGLFTKVLLAELEDLEDDIASWAKFLEDKHRADKVTEYVFLQNSALFGQELAGLRRMVRAIGEETPPESLRECADPSCIRDYFIALAKRESERYEFQRAIERFVVKKIEKVYAYVADTDRES